MKNAINALSALAQETRLTLFRALVKRGPQGYAAGDLGKQLAIPAATLSFHLNQLSQAGLVQSRREGRSINYSANYAGMQTLMDYLSENCCQDGGCDPAC